MAQPILTGRSRPQSVSGSQMSLFSVAAGNQRPACVLAPRTPAKSQHRERNAQDRRGHVDRDCRRGRHLRGLSPGFVVVRFWIGDGLGRGRILGKESGLELTPSATSWPLFTCAFGSTESLREQMPALIYCRPSLYA